MHVAFLCADSNVILESELEDIANLRASSPVVSMRRGSQCSQVIIETFTKGIKFFFWRNNEAEESFWMHIGCIKIEIINIKILAVGHRREIPPFS